MQNISKLQCGYRKNRSTVNHLVRMESLIRTAFAKGEHFISVFYDLEEAYDRTWRYGVLKDLQCRITGAAANICEELLTGKENECKDRRMYFA